MRLLLPLALSLAAPPPSPAPPADPVAALRQELDARAARGEFSGAVLLARGDEVLLRAAYGLAAREDGRANTPETRFNLGSINKAFTRLAIEQLAQAGRLSLSDTLDRHVPEYPVEKGRRITLQHLLEHRGGTGDVFGPRFDAADRTRLRTLRDWLPLITGTPLGFEPGARQEYSNAGYILLGLVIEKVSGRSYDDYVSEHVFAPAGMTNTGALAIAALANAATGYTRRGGGELADNRRFLPARGSSAGGGYSTVDDLFRFAQALRAGALGPKVRGGLGVAGGAPGVNAVLEVMPEHTLVVLANLDPPAAQAIARLVRESLGDRDEVEVGRGQ